MALKVVAGSVPMATATSMRSSRMLVTVVGLRDVMRGCGGGAAGGEGHEVDAGCGVGVRLRGGGRACARRRPSGAASACRWFWPS